jgi:hypothetical protein
VSILKPVFSHLKLGGGLMKNNMTKVRRDQIGYLQVDAGLLSVEDRKVFMRRKQAIELKLDGYVGSDIRRITGIPESELTRFLKRYTEINEFGIFWGEAALIPHARINKNLRRKPLAPKGSEQQGGLTGALSFTLSVYPNIVEKFVIEVLRLDEEYGHGRPYEKRQLCNLFYDICKGEGVKDNEWPFNQSRGARRTITKYIDDLLQSDFQKAALATGGATSLIHSKVGTGNIPLIESFDAFDLIEIDSYYVDAFFVLNISGDKRTKTKDVISRIWLIAAICRSSNAILAIKFVFSSQIRSQDLVDLICEAYAGNWAPREHLKVRDLKYSDASGMPSYSMPELKHHTWGGVCLDNAMQHHANKVFELALHNLGFSLNYGPLAQPAQRPNVERLFRRIASKVMQQIPSTTGSSPQVGRAAAPEKAAIHYQIDVDEALEVMDVYTANYNGVPQGGKNKANSPLEILRQYCATEGILIPTSSEVYLNTLTLGSTTKEVTVRGSIEKGIRPRIKLDQALYTSPELACATHLIGKKIIVRIQPNDYRYVEAYLPSGVYFSTLTVESAWRQSPHSVTTRKLVNRALSKCEFQIVEGQDPVLAWQKHLRKNANPSNNREMKRMLDEASAENNHRSPMNVEPASPISCTEGTSSERWKKLGLFD